MTRGDVVELFGVIKALYQNQFDGDDVAVDVWHCLLASYTRENVFGALHEFAEIGGDFPPNCAQLLRRAKTCEQPNEKWLKLAAQESWREILGNMGRTSDATGTEALHLMGGWRMLGSMPASQIEPWERRRFLELYLDLSERESFLRLADTRNDSGQGVVTLLDESRAHEERRTGSDEWFEELDLAQALRKDRSDAR